MTPGSPAARSTTAFASTQPPQPWAVNSSTTTGEPAAAAARTGLPRAPTGWATDPTDNRTPVMTVAAMIQTLFLMATFFSPRRCGRES